MVKPQGTNKWCIKVKVMAKQEKKVKVEMANKVNLACLMYLSLFSDVCLNYFQNWLSCHHILYDHAD